MQVNARQFQESITSELIAVKNRVRNLIGDANWGDEGRFKEAILRNSIKKFLPQNLSVGTGFILNANGENDQDTVVSRQLDIIIYDNTYPLLFSEGDFIITTARNVRGVIEVKSNITHNTINGVITQFDNSIREFIGNFHPRIFFGIFSFDYLNGKIDSANIDNSLINSRKIVNHICLGPDFFIRHWQDEARHRLGPPEITCEGNFYNVYEIPNLSFSYFISNLIDIVCGGLQDRYWLAFPIANTKEVHRLRTICLPQ